MWEIWVQSLGWEGPLGKEMIAHSIILAWRIPWTEEPGELQSMGSWRVRHDWVTHTHTQEGYSFCIFHCLDSMVDVFHLVDLSCVPFQFTTFSESPSRVKFQPYLAPQIKDTCAPTTDIDSLGSHVKCANTVSSHYNRQPTRTYCIAQEILLNILK